MASSILNNSYLSSLNIDLISTDADINISDTHKIFYLNQPIIFPQNTHALIALSQFNMPYTFYMFRSGINNTFDIQTYDGIDYNLETITITEGNYSIPELLSHINSSLTAVRLALGLTTLSITANYTNNTLFFTALPLKQEIQIKNILCWKEVGFANSNTVTYSSLTNLQLPFCFNLAGDPSLYIRLHNLGINNINSKKKDGILCNIPNTFMPLEYIYYKPNELHYFKTTSLLNVIEVSILDENMEDIGSLNTNSGFRMTLSIHFSYNKEIILPSNDTSNQIFKYSAEPRESVKKNDEK